MKELIAKSEVLVEALPYIQKFRGEIVVVKFGGSSMEDPELVKSTMCDIVLMECIGMRPVVVHGGGKAITAELAKQKIETRFVNGLRVTCGKTIDVVDEVLHNVINRSLVEFATEFGGHPVAVSGKSVLKAEKLYSKDKETGEKIDIGFVGDVVEVDRVRLQEAINNGIMPIITPLAKGDDGNIYNINADIAACRIAESLRSRKLVFLSDVPGIMSDPADESTVISSISTDEIDGMIKNKIISGGMIPKVMSSIRALEAGTNKVHMIDGRIKHSLLLEIFTNHGIGTQIVRPDSVL
ncbi:MAG: acetylglutamate kinase [Victivallaceae bacterium]|jgi:acetylglutamate kinase|nr:acetylglutamate kinase [Victivallaceae bacterium]NLK83943.1 acetylglutamate kinase [Lentisphaerota bacterium]MDD3116757.1 acetylglutamate kinase [Victivallaceae bacterium]MDD3703521.1 acetylglutamate kinase [Victivallaceae bacterium]MDD4317138.1 acetylglutamate kinase [Victivallaceae bacterium]